MNLSLGKIFLTRVEIDFFHVQVLNVGDVCLTENKKLLTFHLIVQILNLGSDWFNVCHVIEY